MRKILAPADKVLSEIGRFVLLRPRISGLLLLMAIIITIFSNHLLDNTSTDSSVSAPTPMLLSLSEVRPPAPILSNVNSTSIPSNTVLNQPVPKEDQPAIKPATNLVANSAAAENWRVIEVRSGDNLAKIFKRNDLKQKDLVKLASLTAAKKLHHLKPGQEIHYQTNAQGQLQQMALIEADKTHSLIITANNGIFKVVPSITIATSSISSAHATSPPANLQSIAIASVQKETVKSNSKAAGLNYASGEISHSLYKDAHHAGLSVKQAQELSHIFNTNGLTNRLKVGDDFSVLYEAGSDTHKAGLGNILAAQVSHQGRNYQLIRFTAPNGHTDYYTPEGESLYPGLMRAPVNYERISSPFTSRRLDPVLHIIHPHLGVDYAAPRGTPVKAAGDGVVAAANYRGGYGYAVIIKHDAKYTTLYAHLSKFAAHLRTGMEVKQGQVIGYVGQTGFATGPHLHFEMHVNDVPANPLTVALPGKRIPEAWRNAFFAHAKMLLAQLKSRHQIQLAEGERENQVKKS